jgi:hypothetical protein
MQELRPTIMIGSSGKKGAFTKEVLETLSSFNKVLMVFENHFPLKCDALLTVKTFILMVLSW